MSVIRKRLEKGGGAVPRGMTMDRALRLAAGRAFRADGGPGVQVTAVTSQTCDAEAVATACPTPALFVVLDGPDGKVGGFAMSDTLVHALVGYQLLGKIPQPATGARPVTRVEAALVAPLIDGFLSRLVAAWAEDKDIRPGWLVDYRFGAMVRDPRALGLALASGGGHVACLTCVLGEGEVEGDMLFFLPKLAEPEGKLAAEDISFPETVRNAPLVLTAILARMTLSFSRVQDLAVGQVLDLPLDAIATAQLAPRGGGPGLRVRLGKAGGMRAVRLLQDVGTARDPGNLTRQGLEGPPAAERAEIAAPPSSFAGAPISDADTGQGAQDLAMMPQASGAAS